MSSTETRKIRKEEVARQILEYLQRHPHASDTLDGIAKWWVMEQRLSESVLIVRQALEQLEMEGVIHARNTPDGRTLYFAMSQS